MSLIAIHPHPSHQRQRKNFVSLQCTVQYSTDPGLDQIGTLFASKDSVGLTAANYTEVKIYIGTAYTSQRNTRHSIGIQAIPRPQGCA